MKWHLCFAFIICFTWSSCKQKEVSPQADSLVNQESFSPKVLIGTIEDDGTLSPVLTDQTMLEALFRIDYHFPQEDLVFRTTSFGTYKPFQMEYDDLNEHNRRTYYLTALAEKSRSRRSMFIRFELEQEGDSLYLGKEGQYTAFITTCKGEFDDSRCSFLFTEDGFYIGCTCLDRTEKM